MRWCSNCVLPDTRPNLAIGADGICNACATHGTRPAVDWEARERAFASVVASAKARSGGGYDCLIPVSGGKDSTWQVVRCLEYGLTPLCVTWRPPGRTAIGERNLRNLVRLGVDHIDYSISPGVERAFMRRALERHGDPAIPMHMAIFSIPLNIAAGQRIPLVIWGENSAFEYGGTEEESRGFRLDEQWLRKYGVTHGTTWRDWTDDVLTPSRLSAYRRPSAEQLEQAGVLAVFLGYYFPWDPDMTRRVAQEHGFSSRSEGPLVGYYDYADIDDDYISVHHWFKWYKFGFTRLFDNLSLEIRNGRLSRGEAVEIIRRRGDDTPYQDIGKICEFLEISVAEFFEIAGKFRNPEIWRHVDGVWQIPDFLIADWDWTAGAVAERKAVRSGPLGDARQPVVEDRQSAAASG